MRLKAGLLLATLVVALGFIGLQNSGIAADRGAAKQPDQAPPLVLAGSSSTEGFQQYTIEVSGLSRTYNLYVPASAQGHLAPLVIGFHGGGGEGLTFAVQTNLPAMAERYGYVIAAPDGLRESWNTGSIDPQGYSEMNGIDDLGFVSAMMDQIFATGIIDQSKVYAMGMSRGGMMSYYVACSMPGRFAAIAAVSATLSSGICPNSLGTSLLHIHGTADDRVPFQGGHGAATPGKQSWASAADGIQIFAQSGQCEPTFTSEQVAPYITCNHSACPGTDEVEYCLIDGGGHEWPGKETNRHKKTFAAVANFDTTDFIAQFFQKH